MGTTGTGSDAVFAHAAPHFGSRPGILPFVPSATRSAVARRHCGTGTARDLAQLRRWLQAAARLGSEQATAVPVCRGYRRCDRRTHDYASGQAVKRAGQLRYEQREGPHTRGRRAVRVIERTGKIERTGNWFRPEPSADQSDRFVPQLAATGRSEVVR